MFCKNVELRQEVSYMAQSVFGGMTLWKYKSFTVLRVR